MKKIGIIFLCIVSGNTFANCGIPGWPGCSHQDFQDAMRLQEQQYIQQQQLGFHLWRAFVIRIRC